MTHGRRNGKLLVFGTAAVVAALAAGLGSCSGGGPGSGDALILPVFSPAIPLTAAQANRIVERAALSIDAPGLTVAVVDRIGHVLAVWSRSGASVDDQNRAVSVARTGAFMSSSQGPITSRTLEFISTSHFPATFGSPAPLPNPFTFDFSKLPMQRPTTGVANTPQGPLWQIFTSNRGAPLAGPGLTLAETGVETLYNAGFEYPAATNIDDSAPGPGLTYLAGGVPLYDRNLAAGSRVVGGVGVVGATPEACEFAAISGASGTGAVGDDNFFFPAPPEGAIFLVGVLLPYVAQTTRPAGFGAGAFGGVFHVDPLLFGVFPATDDPSGYLIGPRADPLPGGLTLSEVMQIIDQGVATANGTRAAIRLPIGSACKMIFVVTNVDGLILAAFRMEDAPIFSLDVSCAKARTMTYYAGPTLHPLDAIPGLPPGTALTTRTLGFVTQPFYPPGIEGTAPGPLFGPVAFFNQNPAQFNRMGRAAFRAGLQSGMIFFPGATALYNSAGTMIGGLGVSGDGVEQDDFVTAGASEGFEAPLAIRADQFSFDGVALPYFKFPQLPGPGGG